MDGTSLRSQRAELPCCLCEREDRCNSADAVIDASQSAPTYPNIVLLPPLYHISWREYSCLSLPGSRHSRRRLARLCRAGEVVVWHGHKSARATPQPISGKRRRRLRVRAHFSYAFIASASAGRTEK